MKVLVLGYSDIARRRVLPALRALGAERIDVASQSRTTPAPADAASIRLFCDYDVALQQTDATVVYISTVNSAHACWARKALDKGFHVIVDKPAFLGLDETHSLLELAAKQGRCIAEATVYAYHPRIAAALRVFDEFGTRPTRIVASFSFPSLSSLNFRHKRALGGGALWDLGAYAVTPGRIFFDASPVEILGRHSGTGAEVETVFSTIAVYQEARTYVGIFGYGTG